MPYGEAPWIFTGRALYQLQLVPLAEAKKHIPPQFRIVSLFGYTLGGFYLARYDDSPCGPFDELVALAGLAWDPPASAAWAARVLVSSGEARAHGRASCGLPSAAASFETVVSGADEGVGGSERKGTTTVTCPASPSSKEAFDFASLPLRVSRASSRSSSRRSCWWHPREEEGSVVVVRNEDSRGGGGRRRRRNSAGPEFVCSLKLPALPRKKKSSRRFESDKSSHRFESDESSPRSESDDDGKSSFSTFRQQLSALVSSGPRISMKLPSFSGAIPECPGLLKYACDLSATVRLVKPVVVGVRSRNADSDGSDDSSSLSAVLGGKPLLCLEFGEMRMRVEQPELAIVGKKKEGEKKKDEKSVAVSPPRLWSRQPSSSRGALLA